MKHPTAALYLVISVLVVAVTVTGLVVSGKPERANIVGLWQGTLKYPGFESRIAFRLFEQPDGALAAALLLPDQSDDEIPAGAVTLQGDRLHLAVDAVQGSFDGRIDAERRTIDGRWDRAKQPL